MTGPISASRRDFLKVSGAAATGLGLGLAPTVHAAGADTSRVGLIGCGGRGKGAAENICEAAGSKYSIKVHALADIFDDQLKNCRSFLNDNEKCRGKLDISDDRCFVGFDA